MPEISARFTPSRDLNYAYTLEILMKIGKIEFVFMQSVTQESGIFFAKNFKMFFCKETEIGLQKGSNKPKLYKEKVKLFRGKKK